MAPGGIHRAELRYRKRHRSHRIRSICGAGLAQLHLLARGASGSVSSALGPVLPDFWGRPDKVEFIGSAGIFADHAFYIGALPAILASIGVIVSRRRDGRFFAVLGVATALLAFDTPVFHLASSLPGLSKIGMYNALFVTTLCGAVLAAYGWQAAISRHLPRSGWVIGLSVAALPLALLVVRPSLVSHLGAALSQFPSLRRSVPTAQVAELGSLLHWLVFAGLGLGLLWIAGRQARRRGLVLALMGVLVVADLLTIDRGYDPIVKQAVATPPVPRALKLASREAGTFRVGGVGETALGPNEAITYGLNDLRGHDDPPPDRYTRLYLALGGAHGAVGVQRTLVNLGAPGIHHLLDVFSTRLLFARLSDTYAELATRDIPGSPKHTVGEPNRAPARLVLIGVATGAECHWRGCQGTPVL